MEGDMLPASLRRRCHTHWVVGEDVVVDMRPSGAQITKRWWPCCSVRFYADMLADSIWNDIDTLRRHGERGSWLSSLRRHG
jgi:hypothetical protein